MTFLETSLPGVVGIAGLNHPDHRGEFVEIHGSAHDAHGLTDCFSHEGAAVSCRGVLRGIHYQEAPHQQFKVVTVLFGLIFDVVVDVKTFAWERFSLFAGDQLRIPRGFAHGYQVLSESAVVHYRCTSYVPEAAKVIRYDDPRLKIRWPLPPILSVGDGGVKA